ncbi:Hypothetical predicted protein [Lecanosticta acicola]|uniref:C2 NT-type domain-containing protein n=1 Tax=Lecanosticta acicola TaxID=111012 RepID=A0AAI8YXH5_9PEZI|nr:Hypothetical predicted protein [Lecanosticta acicola]
MSTAFISKSRRIRFEFHLHIHDLNNVPLVSGTSFIKWHLPASTAAEHRGRTAKAPIRDHRVQYAYTKRVPVRLTVGKGDLLQECRVEFEVLQEYSAGGRGERIVLGHVALNLAEYVEVHDVPTAAEGGGGGGVTRRYLMQDSKINSTLKLTLSMRHLEGTRDYMAPPLRAAPVFGGIAGILSSSEPAAVGNPAPPAPPPPPPPSAGGGAPHHHPHHQHLHPNFDGEDASQQDLPHFSSTNREMGEMQDMYRRTLAAFWASQPGELRADECIEDIFAGGDGWGKSGKPLSGKPPPQQQQQSELDTVGGGGSGASTPNPDGEKERHGHAHAHGNGRHHQKNAFSRSRLGRMGKQRHDAGELDEMDVREDLTSWQIGEGAHA